MPRCKYWGYFNTTDIDPPQTNVFWYSDLGKDCKFCQILNGIIEHLGKTELETLLYVRYGKSQPTLVYYKTSNSPNGEGNGSDVAFVLYGHCLVHDRGYLFAIE